MADTLLMLSGGIDSAFCLWQRVQAGLPTRTHHVHLTDAEGRGDVESRAVERVLTWMDRHGGAGLIEHTESSVDFTTLWVPLNHHLWAYWVGAILAAPAGRDYRNVVIPRHADAFHDEPADGPAAHASDEAYLGHIALMAPGRIPTLTYPIRHLMKADIIAQMPPGLLVQCWWCRRPQHGQPCHRCYTCRLVDPAITQEFHTHYLTEWTEATMSATKLTRVEVRVNDRIQYSQDVDVEDFQLVREGGVLTVRAVEPGATAEAPVLVMGDNPFLPPVTGTPDGDDDEHESHVHTPVIERVHTGEAYNHDQPASRSGGKAKKAAAPDIDLDSIHVDVNPDDLLEETRFPIDGPTGTVISGVVNIERGKPAETAEAND